MQTRTYTTRHTLCDQMNVLIQSPKVPPIIILINSCRQLTENPVAIKLTNTENYNLKDFDNHRQSLQYYQNLSFSFCLWHSYALCSVFSFPADAGKYNEYYILQIQLSYESIFRNRFTQINELTYQLLATCLLAFLQKQKCFELHKFQCCP